HDEPATERLHDDQRVDRVAAGAAVGLGQRDRQRAEIGELAPEIAAEAGVGGDDVLALVELVAALEQPRERVAQLVLLLGEVEVHGYSPSMCLAMMLRWISLDPA